MPARVAIAYPGFGDIKIEREVLSTIDAEVWHVGSLDTAEALDAVRQADALMVTIQKVPAELINQMASCQIISRVGTGLDAIDIPVATEHGIWVTNVPDYSIDEVATHALALLLAYARGIPQLAAATRQGHWDSSIIGPRRRLRGQVLGVVGFGRIGQAMAAKGRGIGLDVIAYDPVIPAEVMEAAGVRSVDWDTLLRTSDYISLHTPLIASTRGLINADALARMQPTAYLINCARGELIDDEALVQAVRQGQIAGAGLDVLAVEPAPADHPFLQEERITLTPHAAWYSEEAKVDVRVRGADEVVRVLRGEKPRCPANQVNGRKVNA